MLHYLGTALSFSGLAFLTGFPAKQTSRRYPWFWVCLSSSFFGLAWCSAYFGWLLGIAIIPMLLVMEARIAHKKCTGLGYVFLTLLLWNTLTLWWLYHAAPFAFLFTALYNAFCLFVPWLLYYYLRKWGGLYIGYMGLLTAWLTLEYAHLGWKYWELTFPWLNLGNGLAAMAPWIQWYAYTGILGGSLWILGINILLYHLLFKSATALWLKITACWILLPITSSLLLYYSYSDRGIAVEVVTVQPNFNSYTEKVCTSPSFVPYAEQIDRLLTLSKGALSPATSVIIWPESAIHTWLNEARIPYYAYMQPIWQLLQQLPTVHIITGASSFCAYGPTKITQTARKIGETYIDFFNSILHLNNNKKIDIYHKEKRLPGAEYIPYAHLLPEPVLVWVKQLFADIGDIDPTLGKGNGAKLFDIAPQIKVVPVNCYESIYGAFVGEATQKGATLLAILTNDNWWGDTPVYHQHFHYSRLLAIAHRRSIVRSANTGISGFINQRGDVLAATNRLEAAAMQQRLYAHNTLTFYTLHGDYIGQIAAWACLCLLITTCMACWYKKKSLLNLS
ncbi:MAG: apolipoprotein N-acyltransferase [Candidatus Cardinium sp.]|nr:apolipoprotein N-acyltransferase [Candidatus Cardinium sp.]